VRESSALSRAAVCQIFGIDAAQICDHVEFDPALAINFTIYRWTRAAARATPTSLAASNMVLSSTSKCREDDKHSWKEQLEVGFAGHLTAVWLLPCSFPKTISFRHASCAGTITGGNGGNLIGEEDSVLNIKPLCDPSQRTGTVEAAVPF
jgi:hypothetical protein